MSFGRKIASVFTLALAIITLTTFVAAQDDSTNTSSDRMQKERRGGRGDGYGKRGGKGMRDGRRGGFGMHGLKNLDLTDAQKEQVRGIMGTAKTANEPLRQEMRLLMEKRRGGGELTETDRTRLKELRSQMKQSHEQIENTIMGVLTAEQRQKFEQMKEEHQKRREEFREKRRQNNQTTPEKGDGK
ncbi:MAG: Spy/CpxP family protein refolding chaperone [Pyrinomonadaceae bacterium]